jgi:hypothetical protein
LEWLAKNELPADTRARFRAFIEKERWVARSDWSLKQVEKIDCALNAAINRAMISAANPAYGDEGDCDGAILVGAFLRPC